MSRPYPDGISRDLFAVRMTVFEGGLPILPTTSSADVLRARRGSRWPFAERVTFRPFCRKQICEVGFG